MNVGGAKLSTIEFTTTNTRKNPHAIRNLLNNIGDKWIEDGIAVGFPTTVSTFIVPSGSKNAYIDAYNNLENKWSVTVDFSWTEAPDTSNSNLGIILGLSLGLGIPLVGVSIVCIILGVKLKKNKVAKPKTNH